MKSSKLKNTSHLSFILSTILVASCGGGGSDSGGVSEPDGVAGTSNSKVNAHHVYLTGKATQETVRLILKQGADYCRIRANAPNAKVNDPTANDPGEVPTEPLIKIDRHVYYGKQATITYETRGGIKLNPATCKFEQKVPKKTATLWTPKGACYIDLDSKVATAGGDQCRAAETYVTTNAALPTQMNASDWGKAEGEDEIAGQKCTIYRGYLIGIKQNCVRTPSGFAPYKDQGTFYNPQGLRLSEISYFDAKYDKNPDAATLYLNAVEVQEDIQMAKEVFLPHLQGGFTVK
jgi:hypothetical protein